MVTPSEVWAALAEIPDPEIPAISLVDLGVVRDVEVADGAVWANASANLSAFAGQTIRLRVEASDASGASLVEAAIDNVNITRQ